MDQFRDKRTQSSNSIRRDRSDPQTRGLESRQRRHSMGSQPFAGHAEEVRYEGNLNQFYRQLNDREEQLERRVLSTFDRMRSEQADQRRHRRQQREHTIQKPFYTNISEFAEKQKQLKRADKKRRKELIKRPILQLNASQRAQLHSNREESDFSPQPGFVDLDFMGTVYNDFSDLNRERDRRFRENFNAAPKWDNKIGSGVDESWGIRRQLMQPLSQRSASFRDQQNRDIVDRQLNEAHALRYRTDRRERQQKKERMAKNWCIDNRDYNLPPIEEVTPQMEQWWDYDFDELD